MKLLNAVQIREWDQYTINNEPISSLNLMERAAKACTKWILQNTLTDCYYIFCGRGNNGGDGLAIARLLKSAGRDCKVFVAGAEAKGSDDFQANFVHLHQAKTVPITILRSVADVPKLPADAIVIDALFGTGLSRPLDGINEELVNYLNNSGCAIISIDIASGMFCDDSSLGNAVIMATHTLTFQCLKLAFLMPENEPYFGQVHILDINLHPDFSETIETRFQFVNKAKFQSLLKPRPRFAHKGVFGHALLITGSYGKMGATVLAAKACVKSGAGLVTSHIPQNGLTVLQVTMPEVMCDVDENEKLVTELPKEINKYTAIGIGPGIGTADATSNLLQNLFTKITQPLVIDADALNILAAKPELLRKLPANCILTPHPKEFARMFGASANEFRRLELALQKAAELNVIIVLKGHYSFIATPSGAGYFNITGNSGMATGGSGDVLTGIITGLLAQGYQNEDAALAGVFLHGLAGDLAAGKFSPEAMTASDIIEMIGNAYRA